MSVRTITAMFDDSDAADRARDRLVQAGLPADDVQVIYQGRNAGRDGNDDKGLWESIKDFFTGEDDDRATYEEGLRRGGHLLTARADDARADEVIALLETCGAIDMDQRATEWRTAGWSAGAETRGDSAMRQEPATQASTEETIPVVQERLRVGKREVGRGGVRVRSYVVEEPVEQQVNLREERVDVERRPVGQRMRPEAADELLRDRTIEMTESAEEAVVSKDAEVTEEVVVRKFEGERTEGVSDTVRRTEVDVENTTDDEDTRGTVPPGAGRRSRAGRTDRPTRR